MNQYAVILKVNNHYAVVYVGRRGKTPYVLDYAKRKKYTFSKHRNWMVCGKVMFDRVLKLGNF
jgi:hypothetical protein